jgi:putative transposase
MLVSIVCGTDLTITWDRCRDRGRVYRPRSRLGRLRRHSCRCAGDVLRGAGADRQGVRRHFGGMVRDSARSLAVRHDHESHYMTHQFRNEIAFLGIESAPTFVRSPEDNDRAEWFIRALKENLLWVWTSKTVHELRQTLSALRETSLVEYLRRQLQPLAQVV